MTSSACDWGSARAMSHPPSNTLSTSSLPNRSAPDKVEQRQSASSPAPHATHLKRQLSPASAAFNDQDSKRPRADHRPVACLHCSCPSHRWTSCFNPCNHCGERHLGKRCPSLSVDAYTPGGFTVNSHFLVKDEMLPPLKLTCADVAVPDYAIAQEEEVGIGPPEMAHIAPASAAGRVSVEGGPDGAVQSSVTPHVTGANSVDGGKTKYSKNDLMGMRDVATYVPSDPAQYQPAFRTSNGLSAFGGLPSGPAAQDVKPSFSTSSSFDDHAFKTDNDKMDAGRATLIAVTSGQDFNPTGDATPVGEVDGLGPKSSGMNNTPLGTRKWTGMSASANIKAGPGSGKMDSMWASRNAALPRGQRQGQREVDISTNRLSPANTGTSFNGGSKAVATQSSLGNGSSNPAANTIGSNVDARSTTPADASAERDERVWKRLVSQVDRAIRETARPGKPFNGTNSRTKIARTQQALGLLKPMITGSLPDTINAEPVMVGQTGALAPGQIGPVGTISLNKASGIVFKFNNQGASAKPPEFVWNAAASGWELVFP